MTSYFGAHGGIPRCAEFWIDFHNCMNTATDGRACAGAQADYMECLHHDKEYARIDAIQQRKNQLIKDGKYTPPKPSS